MKSLVELMEPFNLQFALSQPLAVVTRVVKSKMDTKVMYTQLAVDFGK